MLYDVNFNHKLFNLLTLLIKISFPKGFVVKNFNFDISKMKVY